MIKQEYANRNFFTDRNVLDMLQVSPIAPDEIRGCKNSETIQQFIGQIACEALKTLSDIEMHIGKVGKNTYRKYAQQLNKVYAGLKMLYENSPEYTQLFFDTGYWYLLSVSKHHDNWALYHANNHMLECLAKKCGVPFDTILECEFYYVHNK